MGFVVFFCFFICDLYSLDIPNTPQGIEAFTDTALKTIEISIEAYNSQDLKNLNYQTVVENWQEMIDPFVFKQALLLFLPMLTENQELIEKAESSLPSLHEKLSEICSDEKTINIVLSYGDDVVKKNTLTPSQVYVLAELIKSIKNPRALKLSEQFSKLDMKPFTYAKGIETKHVPSKKITFLNWNICCFDEGLSILFGGIVPWEERIDHITDVIKKSQRDVICLQEVFAQKAHDRLFELLKDTYGYFYKNIGPRINGFNLLNMGISSGLFVASKYPLTNPFFQHYDAEATPNTRAYGFFSAQLPSLIRFITTQLQPDSNSEDIKFRKNQLKAIKAHIDENTILLGDLNIQRDSDEYKQEIGPYFENHYTDKDWTCCDLKDFWWKAEENIKTFQTMVVFEWIDYLLTPKNSPLKLIRTGLIKVNDPERPKLALSDHQAMISYIEIPSQMLEKDEMKDTPEHLYKIVSPEVWKNSQEHNQVMPSGLDDHFIHLATEEQVPHILQKFWNQKDHVILKLDSKKLIGRMVYETNPGGSTRYYHLYEGKIPLDAVLEVF